MGIRNCRAPSGGYTLIEVICSFAVVSLITLGVMGSIVSTLRIDRESSRAFSVENLAAAQMEEYLATSFYSLSPGAIGPAVVDGCQVTVWIFEIEAGTLTSPPRIGIEVNVADAADPQIKSKLVCARTTHTF